MTVTALLFIYMLTFMFQFMFYICTNGCVISDFLLLLHLSSLLSSLLTYVQSLGREGTGHCQAAGRAGDR
jgi:hypothetical protein